MSKKAFAALWITAVVVLITVCVFMTLFAMFPIMDERLMQAHYDLMGKFVQFAQKHELRYFVEGGTLLGCIRHEAFVPWDNDIDIGILVDTLPQFLLLSDEMRKDGLYLQQTLPLPKIWSVDTGPSSSHNQACIDVFVYRRMGDRVEYLDDFFRSDMPTSWFRWDEIETLKPYQFGELEVMGPNVVVPDYCVRTWGNDWLEPRFKKEFRLLYPIQCKKMGKAWLDSDRYQKLKAQWPAPPPPTLRP